MAFRADESISIGYDRVRDYLISRHVEASERARSADVFNNLYDKFGPVIDDYPSWHPLVSNSRNDIWPATRPSRECGYDGLDHTICFRNAFITCPYDDGQEVMDAVESLPPHSEAEIAAERLDVQFYNSGTTTILVSCTWHTPFPIEGMIPKKLAVPLMVERELPHWRNAELAETWETMRPFFLGRPHGGRSSLFVNQQTGQAMKNVWNALIKSGMFGPVKV